jgi:hypothetical protein
MIFSIYPASGSRVGVTQLAVAAIFAFTTLTTAQAIQPTLQYTSVTLSLPGVVGDVTIPGAPANSIGVQGFSLGASVVPPLVSNVSISKPVDDASPALFLATLTSTTYATAVFNFWEFNGTTYTKTYTIYLTQAKITSESVGGGGGGGATENVSFSFNTIALYDNLSGAVACYNVSTKATSSSSETC